MKDSGISSYRWNPPTFTPEEAKAKRNEQREVIGKNMAYPKR